ncbi:hypothetical protein [Limnohabitans sp. T6-5]|uniref:hypothetical protein n=1 Tax=Limnohabitans sp. T6-5 TaxID=1100724 RepID=UPI0011B220B7|nr:hypothetical protein [Limnohabitans sp. T6-5]
MNIFETSALALGRRDLVTGSQIRATFRWMRLYASASNSGVTLPQVPKRVSKSLSLLALTSAFRLAIHEPAVLAIGVICTPPTILYGLWAVVFRLFRLIGA